MPAKPINILYVVLATVAGTAFGAWWAGSRIESPAELALRTAAPAPSPILVPAEKQVLSSEIVTRGTARFGLPRPVALVPSPLKSGAGLITTLPVRNTQLEEGDVLLTASGRPVFVLQGEAPPYRDLGPGAFGQDVAQLERALARLGFDPGPIDGLYDQQTGAAAARLYKAEGWEPFGATREQLTALRMLERDFADALKAKLTAEAAMSSAGLAIDAAWAAAEASRAAAAIESATRQTEQLRTVATANRVVSTLLASEHARTALANSAAEAEVATLIAERALIALDPRQPQTARNAADAKLALARMNRTKIRLEGELALQTVERDGRIAGQRVAAAQAAERAARLEGAKNARAAQDAQRLAGYDAKSLAARVEELTRELDTAKRKLGVQVPVDEVVFIPSLPVRVGEVTASIGATASGPLLSVTNNIVTIDASVALESAALLKPDMKVTIDEQTLGLKTTGVIEQVASTPGTHGVDGFHVYFAVRVDPSPLHLEGYSLRLTIPTESTKEAVLTVPLSAVSLAADGTSRVQVERRGSFDYVTVKPGLAANGYLEVTPLHGTLTPGQNVVVGFNTPGAPPAAPK